MLRPNKDKKEKIKLSKDSYAKARRIFSYIGPYKGTFIIGWIFLVFSSSVGLLFPYLMGQLLGSPANMADLSSPEQSSSLLQLDSINSIAFALFILFLLQSVFSYFRIILFTRVTENTLRDLRYVAFNRLIHMPMDFFNKNKVGELTSRISGDLNLIQETMRTTIAEFFRQVVIVLGVVIWLFFLSWELALIMLATVPVMAIVAVFFGRFIRGLSKKAQDSAAASNGIIEESLIGISNVKSFTNEALELLKFKKAIEEIRQLNIKSGNWRGIFVSFIFLCLFGAIIFIIWKGVHMVQVEQAMSLADFFSFIMFTVMLGASVGSLPDLFASIQKAVGSTEHLMNIIEEASEQELLKGKQEIQLHGKIEFKDVRFAYPQRPDVEVLKGLSFEAQPGETIALVGSSGAGKSTISSLLLNYYTIRDGAILFDNNSIDTIEVKNLRSQMAIVPQEVILFSGTIRENIAYGNPDATEEEIREAARQANAFDFIESFPDKFNTEVGDRGIQLSGGQKQRIAIARAVLKDPAILILDEATSALDSESEKLVQEALDKLMVGRTSIVIAHRLSTIRKADKIIVIDNGKVVESGKHEVLMEIENGIYSNLMQLQGGN
ncbi:ABC transporter transmembrane domain-containing protein [Wandonia haliotis]|uniref:ABC transporter transmembrane domain-containing protein n=1 Tax=Wandonia haliotis TaxID=574963 RepID=A0ABN1MQ89_9FLAO